MEKSNKIVHDSADSLSARVESCKANVFTFNGFSATVAQKKAYAACIDVLHPEPVQVVEKEAPPSAAHLIVVTMLILLMACGAASIRTAFTNGVRSWLMLTSSTWLVLCSFVGVVSLIAKTNF